MLDSAMRYGYITRFFHWLMALLIVQQFLKLGDRVSEGEHWLGETFGPWHTSIGALLLALVVLRLLWAGAQRQRRPLPESLPLLVKAGHGLLYTCMLLMPVTGILYMLGKGYGLKLFGVQLVARSGVETGWLAALGSLHSPIAWLFLVLILGHVAAALFHHFVKDDDTLRRMAG
ncbi:cytochrome b [Azotobacter armeniacus]